MKPNVRSLNYATILTIILVVMLTLWSEVSLSFKTLLASVTGHHWTTKGVFSLVFFVAAYFITSRIGKDRVEADSIQRAVYAVVVTTVLGGLVILGFYIWHFAFQA